MQTGSLLIANILTITHHTAKVTISISEKSGQRGIIFRFIHGSFI